jgi:hypothetical protein
MRKMQFPSAALRRRISPPLPSLEESAAAFSSIGVPLQLGGFRSNSGTALTLGEGSESYAALAGALLVDLTHALPRPAPIARPSASS